MLLRREQLVAAEEKRSVRRLSSFDFLTGIDDFSRMGGFRFKETPDSEFINVSESLKIPPLTDIRGLIAASAEIEKSEENNMLPDRKWIAQLVQPGTSLGGARPKANVKTRIKLYTLQSSHHVKMITMPDFGNISATCLLQKLG